MRVVWREELGEWSANFSVCHWQEREIWLQEIRGWLDCDWTGCKIHTHEHGDWKPWWFSYCETPHVALCASIWYLVDGDFTNHPSFSLFSADLHQRFCQLSKTLYQHWTICQAVAAEQSWRSRWKRLVVKSCPVKKLTVWGNTKYLKKRNYLGLKRWLRNVC